MSYHYSPDSRRQQREKGHKQYEDAVESYTESETELHREANVPHDEHARRRREDQEHDAEDRFGKIGNEVAGEHDRTSR